MKFFKSTAFYTLFFSVLLLGLGSFLQACGKDKDKPQPPQEAPLVVSLDPAPSNSTTPVQTLTASYSFKVKVDSQMPTQGVTISVVYKQDSDNQVVFTQNYTTSASYQVVNVTNIPYNEVGTVTAVVTSKTKSDNTVTKTFKLVRK